MEVKALPNSGLKKFDHKSQDSYFTKVSKQKGVREEGREVRQESNLHGLEFAKELQIGLIVLKGDASALEEVVPDRPLLQQDQRGVKSSAGMRERGMRERGDEKWVRQKASTRKKAKSPRGGSNREK